VVVERLEAFEPRPFHGLVFEGNTPCASVQVRLFGQLAFRVRFAQLAIGGPRACYTHDLVTGRETLEALPEPPVCETPSRWIGRKCVPGWCRGTLEICAFASLTVAHRLSIG
jgi:hypothetical protein